MYKHYNEPLFDYIIIRETGEFSSEGYKTAHLFDVNYEDESKEIPCGYIDCFTVSPSCQFDFHKKWRNFSLLQRFLTAKRTQ